MGIEEEVRALEPLGLEVLRAVWRSRYGDPPKLRSVALLRSLLAWRLQAEAQGGLDAVTRQALKRAGARPDTRAGLGEGALISREWRGRRHDVERIEGGFRYDGRTFRSLSEVARTITGVRWNGPRFFGLRQEKTGGEKAA